MVNTLGVTVLQLGELDPGTERRSFAERDLGQPVATGLIVKYVCERERGGEGEAGEARRSHVTQGMPGMSLV